jgi:hypothetical protein
MAFKEFQLITMNPMIIAKYRQVDWIVAIYRHIALQFVCRLTPANLEPHFGRWASWSPATEETVTEIAAKKNIAKR